VGKQKYTKTAGKKNSLQTVPTDPNPTFLNPRI